MWPAIAILALLVGFSARRKKKGDSEPLLEEGDPEATAAEAAAAAAEALEEAQAGAAEGDSEKAAGALEKAADAAQAAAGTSAADIAAELARQVEALAAAAAAKAGQPPPQTKAPKPTKTSPGLPPVSSEPDEVEVEVEDEDETDEPGATGSVVTDAIRDAAKAAADALGVPTDAKTGTPPLATEETKPTADPAGTVALARHLLAREQSSGWKQVDAKVRQWQARQGLVQDGKFGPKSSLKMGSEVGVLPKVRYWPSGSAKKTALQRYRDDVHTLAATMEAKGRPAHSRALELSAELEDARAHGVASPKPVTSVDRVAQFKTLREAIG